MHKYIIKTFLLLALSGLVAALAYWDLGFEVFPVFGQGLRISMGISVIALLGTALGPLKGTLGALAGGYVGQWLVPEIAFAGPYTFAAAALIALVCGMMVKRNWLGALLVAAAVAGGWLWTTQGLEAGVFSTVFLIHMFVLVVLAGIYGTVFLGGSGPVFRLAGYLLVTAAGTSTAMLGLAALSARYYTLPEYMWNAVAMYQFLRFLYIFTGFSLAAVWLGNMVIGHFFVFRNDRLSWNRKNIFSSLGKIRKKNSEDK